MTPAERSTSKPLIWGKRLAILAVAGVSLWAALGVTLTLVVGRSQPAMATALWPYGADSNAALAEVLLRSSDREGARLAAQKALRREPVNVLAVRTLALLATSAGDESRSKRLLTYSETLSRRDAATQLSLIEASVAAGDIDGALRHYDRAMRTSLASRDLLIPVLAKASSNPYVLEPLTKLVGTRPPWWSDLVEGMIAEDGAAPAAIAAVLKELKLDPRGDHRWLLSRSLNRMIDQRATEAAFAIYQQSQGTRPASPVLLRDGDFSAEHPVPPFDWALQEQPGLSAAREARTGVSRGFALSIVAEPGRAGEVARQLLVLEPGSYRLRATVGDVPSDEHARPAVSVMCLQGPAGELARLAFPAAVSAGRAIQMRFVVPQAGCVAQWIRIESGTGPEQQPTSVPWVASMILDRL